MLSSAEQFAIRLHLSHENDKQCNPMAGPLVEVKYFKPACNRVLQPYLGLFGFSQTTIERDGVQSSTAVAYRKDDMFIDFSYWPEDFPNYCVMVGLGLIEGDVILPQSEIGLWYAIPRENQEIWAFQNEAQLRATLTHIRDDILPIYAEPLWEDTQLLEQAINRFNGEQEAKIEQREVEKLRQQAEAAFRSGHFEQSIHVYSQMSPVDLSATDRKRLEIARKKLGKSEQ